MTGKNSNGCSFVPDHNNQVHTCCDQHDEDYANPDIKRAIADKSLYTCIKSTGHPKLAWLYYRGVRMFGWLFRQNNK